MLLYPKIRKGPFLSLFYTCRLYSKIDFNVRFPPWVKGFPLQNACRSIKTGCTMGCLVLSFRFGPTDGGTKIPGKMTPGRFYFLWE
jgi:hypothetical protein